MDNSRTAIASPLAPPRHWPFFFLGFLFIILGPALYFIRLRLHHTETPWYMPALTSIGVLFAIVSVWQRRGFLRPVGLLLFVLVCGLQWFYMVVHAKTPSYTGPAQSGSKVPAFATSLSNGEAFTDRDLENGQRTVLLFFRGRW